jgi:hypothetical protein
METAKSRLAFEGAPEYTEAWAGFFAVHTSCDLYFYGLQYSQLNRKPDVDHDHPACLRFAS